MSDEHPTVAEREAAEAQARADVEAARERLHSAFAGWTAAVHAETPAAVIAQVRARVLAQREQAEKLGRDAVQVLKVAAEAAGADLAARVVETTAIDHLAKDESTKWRGRASDDPLWKVRDAAMHAIWEGVRDLLQVHGFDGRAGWIVDRQTARVGSAELGDAEHAAYDALDEAYDDYLRAVGKYLGAGDELSAARVADMWE